MHTNPINHAIYQRYLAYHGSNVFSHFHKASFTSSYFDELTILVNFVNIQIRLSNNVRFALAYMERGCANKDAPRRN